MKRRAFLASLIGLPLRKRVSLRPLPWDPMAAEYFAPPFSLEMKAFMQSHIQYRTLPASLANHPMLNFSPRQALSVSPHQSFVVALLD